MKVLVIGSGGREHALVWKLKQSTRVTEIFCAPGNAGISQIAKCIALSSDDVEGLLDFAKKNQVDLTIVGPEAPLTEGIVDIFEAAGLRIFGPSRAAAQMEGSKAFSKNLMEKYNIPTGQFAVFSDRDEAMGYLDKVGAPVVVKADGLAAGKGVIVCHTIQEAKDAVDLIAKDRAFGDAGDRIIIEEFLEGEEASFIAFTDGKTVLPLPTSQDHKAVFDGDKGPNTGGMGAYSPAPIVTEAMHAQAMEEVMLPTVKAMAAEGCSYKGMLYAGLMIKDGVARVLEFNCRFGDPECQPLLMRLNNDLVDILEAIIDEKLDSITLDIDPQPTVCVVMASGGYPGSYDKGIAIHGLADAAKDKDVVVFHAGTAIKDNTVVTAGGRVLGVTARGTHLEEAIERAYATVAKISWQGCYYRKDIGHKALKKRLQRVGIIMGSKSDLPIMQHAADILDSFGVSYEMTIASAHRTPARAVEFSSTAKERGIGVIIAGAGMAAHLAGVLAAHTTVPVIGVPLAASALNGIDAMLSTVQMPPGVPVACMGIGNAGAKNGALLAVQMLALSNNSLSAKLDDYKIKMAGEVEKQAQELC